jgi:hypothetical protein
VSWKLSCAVIGLRLLAPAPAWAEPSTEGQPSLGLRWSDPNLLAPTTEKDFDAQLAARMGHPAFVAGTEGPTLSVSWQGMPERCRVELSLARGGGVEGVRVIESPSGDCRSLVPALLTVSALLVESHQSAQESQAAASSSPASSPAPSVPVKPATTEPAPPRPPSPLEARFLLSVGGAVSSGFLPKVELGPAAAAVWAPLPAVRLGVAGSWFLGRDYGEGPGLSLSHQRAALLLCGMPLSRSVALGLCATGGLHHFRAAGTSLPRAETHDRTTWSVGAELRAEWQLTRRLWWVGHAGAEVAARPLYFYYLTASGEARNVLEQRRVNPVLLLALSLEIP